MVGLVDRERKGLADLLPTLDGDDLCPADDGDLVIEPFMRETGLDMEVWCEKLFKIYGVIMERESMCVQVLQRVVQLGRVSREWG